MFTYEFCGMIGIKIKDKEEAILKISTRGRYAFRMMIDLAGHYNDGFVSLKDISKRQNISKKYLEQIIPFLNRSSLLNANKGHMGGYQLANPPSKITVREILESAEGSLAPVSCRMSSTDSRIPANTIYNLSPNILWRFYETLSIFSTEERLL